MSQLHFSI